MQDDIAKMNDNINQARVGCNKIHNTMMRKQLSVNHTKCKTLIVGPKKFRETILNKVKNEPMKMGGTDINHAVNEKYSGDYVNKLGCRQSIEDTIKERMRKMTSKSNDIIMLAEAPMMGADGKSLAAIL